VYPLPAVALAAALLGVSWSAGRARLLLFLWSTPLLFALVNVPAWGFLLAPAQVLGLGDVESARIFERGYILTYQYLAPVLAVAGTMFQVGCALGAWSLVRPISRRTLREALGAPA
jgi:hypothetical protein